MTDFWLFRLSLSELWRPRRLLFSAPLILFPALLAFLWRSLAAARSREFPPEVAYHAMAGALIFGFSLVILAVIFGTGVVAQEVEQRTILYLLTRPMIRVRILAARFLGALLGIVLTTWAATLLLGLATFGPDLFQHAVVRRDLAILPVGALAYGSLFLLLGAAINRSLIGGLFFAFGWESWVPILPGNFQKISIMTWLRTLAPHDELEGEGGLPSGLQNMLEALSGGDLTAQQAWWVLGGVIVVCLLAAGITFSLREYAPRDDAE